MKRRVVVVGGNAAGMSAASQARRAHGDLEVMVFDKGPYVSYGACGIPYYLSGEVAAAEDLLVLSAEDLARRGIQVNSNHLVTSVKPAARAVEVRDAGGRIHTVRYDFLVLSTGSETLIPSWADPRLDNVFCVRDLPDAMAARRFLQQREPCSAVIVGTGFLGFELAEALLKRGLRVTLVGRSRQLLGGLDAEFLTPVLADLRTRGMELLQEAPVDAASAAGGVLRGLRAGEAQVDVEMLFLATGVRPATTLARAAGIALGTSGGIQVSERMKTGTPGVYAAGDCAEVTHVVSGAKTVSPLALTANRCGRIAGDNLAAESRGRLAAQRFRGTAGTTITRVFGWEIGQTGLSMAQAAAAGLTAVEFTRQSRSRAAYYPGGGEVRTRIVVERGTQRLLGAQMLAPEGVAGRIDVLATALFNRMTVQQIYDLDLAYAPPFGPTYDPVIEVCGRAALELGAL